METKGNMVPGTFGERLSVRPWMSSAGRVCWALRGTKSDLGLPCVWNFSEQGDVWWRRYPQFPFLLGFVLSRRIAGWAAWQAGQGRGWRVTGGATGHLNYRPGGGIWMCLSLEWPSVALFASWGVGDSCHYPSGFPKLASLPTEERSETWVHQCEFLNK